MATTPKRQRLSYSTTSFGAACAWLQEYCTAKKLRLHRDHEQDLVFYEPRTDPKTGVFLHCFQPFDSFEKVIAQRIQAWESFDKLKRWAFDNEQIQRYSYDNSAIAFPNGVFFLETGVFMPHETTPSNVVARAFVPYEFGSLETPIFDGLVDMEADFPKIGTTIRNNKSAVSKSKVLFIIGLGFDDRRPLRTAIFDTFHVYDTNLYRHKYLQSKLYTCKKPIERFSHTAFIEFEGKHVTDAMLDIINVASGSALPSKYNKDRVEVVYCTPNTLILPEEHASELPALIKKAVLASLEVERARLDEATLLSSSSVASDLMARGGREDC